MQNTNILYGVIGLLAGLLLAFGSCLMNHHRGYDKKVTIHQMPDGSMMSNSGMEDMMKSMMSGLEGKTGDEFDKAFIDEMIMHHEGAVLMANAVLKNSNRPELVKLANEIISAQTKEIETMQGWKKSWFK